MADSDGPRRVTVVDDFAGIANVRFTSHNSWRTVTANVLKLQGNGIEESRQQTGTVGTVNFL